MAREVPPGNTMPPVPLLVPHIGNVRHVARDETHGWERRPPTLAEGTWLQHPHSRGEAVNGDK